MSCLIISPTVTATEVPKVKLTSVTAVKICLDVITGDAGSLVEDCNPFSSK